MAMKQVQMVLVTMLLTAQVGYSVLLDEDFEAQTVGANPTGAKYVNPTAITATSYVKVVGSNPLGTGNALGMYDNDSANLGLEYNFSSAAAVQVDLTFSPDRSTGGSSSGYMTFALGQNEASTSARLGASARRYAEMRFYGDGDLRFYYNTLGNFVDYNDLEAGSTNKLTVFLNDYDSQSVNYTVGSTTYTLPANSVAWWVNDMVISNGAALYGSLDLGDATAGGTVGTSEGNLGRVGFSDSGVTGIDYLFDNLSVATIAIPEPSTLGMLVFGSLIILAMRRRRMG
jgi:hypothetical protein